MKLIVTIKVLKHSILKFNFKGATNISKNIIDGFTTFNPANIYLLKVNNRNTRKRCEICLKSTIKTPERPQWRLFVVFNVNFEHISHLFLAFLLLTLNKQILDEN